MRNISGLKKPLGPCSPAKKLRSPIYRLDLCRKRNAMGCLNRAVPSSSEQRAAGGSAARGSASPTPRNSHPHVAVSRMGVCYAHHASSGRLMAGARPQTPSGSLLLSCGMPPAAPAASVPQLSEDSCMGRLVQKMQ